MTARCSDLDTRTICSCVLTGNAGISLKNTATISGENNKIYVALTGDQTAITNIRIYK